jgi:hypothetical protein
MPRGTSNANVIATIGIDIAKNTFHVIGLEDKGAIILRHKLSRGQVYARLANIPLLDRHGGVRRGASPGPTTQCAWPRHAADASPVCAALFERPEERLTRRGSDRRGSA